MRRGHWLALGLLVTASLVAEVVADWHYWWERIPAFYALFGFLGFLAIVVVAKGLGKLWIQREEGYWDRD